MAKKNSLLTASSKSVDPTLDALFASSAGPTKAPSKSRYVDLLPPKAEDLLETSDQEEDEEDEEDEEEQSGEDDEDEDGQSSDSGPDEDNEGDPMSDDEDQAAAVLEAVVSHRSGAESGDRKRKRKKRDEHDDIESKYLQKLADDDEEPAGKRQKGEAGEDGVGNGEDVEMSDGDDIPVHESLAADPAANEIERAARTIYISNVSTEAVKSEKAKKTLLAHLESVLDKTANPPQTIESIRFRSIAFSSAAMPKKASYILGNVMEATTRAANAYAVFSDAASCRAACSKLNGTVVLDRHIRVDSVAHPAPVDHKRCVFVGNLGFVDDESVLNTKVDEEGKEITEKRKRTKTPMDVEEGLWRVFGDNAGKVENVRVVRDPVTRVGKGFAYVQFYDGTSVEAALLLAGKKFPPMLPRELRVTRCRASQKTARALEAKKHRTVIASGKKKNTKYVPKPTAESQTLAGRAGKLLGRAGAAQFHRNPSKDKKGGKPRPERRSNGSFGGEAERKPFKSPEEIVFEGRRASAKDGKPKDLKFKGSKPSGQKKSARTVRTMQRTQSWKAKKTEKK